MSLSLPLVKNILGRILSIPEVNLRSQFISDGVVEQERLTLANPSLAYFFGFLCIRCFVDKVDFRFKSSLSEHAEPHHHRPTPTPACNCNTAFYRSTRREHRIRFMRFWIAQFKNFDGFHTSSSRLLQSVGAGTGSGSCPAPAPLPAPEVVISTKMGRASRQTYGCISFHSASEQIAIHAVFFKDRFTFLCLLM
jgi:hypothetical protein